MRLEAQLREQNLRFDRKEQLALVPTTGTSQVQPTFVKPTQAPKTAVKPPLPTSTSQMPNLDKMAGLQTSSLTSMPKLDYAVSSATAILMPEIQTYTLQPSVSADNIHVATVSTTEVHTCTSIVPYCTTVSMLANTVANVANVANLSVMSDNVMPTVSPQQACVDTAVSICTTETNSGVSQNVPQNVSKNPFQNVSRKMPQNATVVDMPLMPVMSCHSKSETVHPSSIYQTFISSDIHLPKQVPATQTQLPTVVVRPPTAPKF